MQHIHFIGVGGVGMNGLAQLALHAGFQTSGSDRAFNQSGALFQQLEQKGVSIAPQDGSGITEKTDCVVFSTAIESDNPDLQKAKELGIPLLHRAQFLKQLVGDSNLIAVAGTAGKTTTTGMLGWILNELGLNPSVYNGAAVLNWKTNKTPGNVRAGDGNLWIIEADESDKSFLQFSPAHSIITNISRDHYELDELNAMFEQFRKQTKGVTIDGPAAPLETASPQSFIYKGIEFSIRQPGQHNLENAFCAVRLCDALNLDLHNVQIALANFKGIERRLENAGTTHDGITVFDDYAHNAAKISAALQSVSTLHSSVHAFWRPHGFAPLHQGKADLVRTFSEHWKATGGSLYILPVYYAGGTVTRKTTSEDLVSELNSTGIPAVFIPDYDALKKELEKHAKPGSAILGMGARDPELPLFAHRLVEKWKKT